LKETPIQFDRLETGPPHEIDEANSQFGKHDEQRISTFHGFMIDGGDEDENADLARHPKPDSSPFSSGIQPRIACDSAYSAQIGYSKPPPLTNTAPLWLCFLP
jgi:hypothetical protein